MNVSALSQYRYMACESATTVCKEMYHDVDVERMLCMYVGNQCGAEVKSNKAGV